MIPSPQTAGCGFRTAFEAPYGTWVSGVAATALGNIGPAAKEAVPALLRAAGREPASRTDERMQECARAALEKIRTDGGR